METESPTTSFQGQKSNPGTLTHQPRSNPSTNASTVNHLNPQLNHITLQNIPGGTEAAMSLLSLSSSGTFLNNQIPGILQILCLICALIR